MKKILLFIVLCYSFTLSAQGILDIGIFNNPVNSDRLEVRIKPTTTVSNSNYTAGVFTIRFLTSYNITLTAPSALNNPLYRYNIANQGTDSLYTYYSFSFVSPFIVNWTSGTEYPIAIVQISSGCSSGDGEFEIINNNWTYDNNGDVYQELNGLEAENIIYQPTTMASLGTGLSDMDPPSITCPADKMTTTDQDHCYHQNIGSFWEAIGSDNCPGFVMNYILSGGTIDTLITLDSAYFNKGITTVNATVTDGAGLTDTCSFTVTVQDMQAPTITAPANITVNANAASCIATGVVLGNPLSADNCPGALVSNNAPASFPQGINTVIWTVTDSTGLTATDSQTVTVQSNLAATALQLSSDHICIGDSVNLALLLTGAYEPYTVVYSANGNNSTVTNYLSGQPIAVSPGFETIYGLVSVSDSIGCAITPTIAADTLTVLPLPTLSGLLPSAAAVCVGESVFFTANGLLPGDSTTINFTLTPGGTGSLTGLSSTAGTFSFDPATNPIGMYSMSIQSITVNGCTSNFTTGNSGSYKVSPIPTIDSISPSASVYCLGATEYIIVIGLPADVSAIINYTINGIPGSETVQTIGDGTAFLLSAIYPEGTYTVVITSVTVAGCSISTNLSTMFTVDPFQPMCGFSVDGIIVTETGAGVEEVNVTTSGIGNGMPFSFLNVTDTAGVYSFANTIPLSSNITITPLKDDNPLNGLTTYDLVLISKHILGISPLGSPYKLIAADANKSNSVTTFDIVEFRKLILGIYQELPNNDSWRFIDKYYVFPDTNNPFVPHFPDTIPVMDVQQNFPAADFVAIKVGDVNGTVVVNANAVADDRRNRRTTWLKVGMPASIQSSGWVKSGQTFTLAFSPTELLAGYQFTLDYNNLDLLDISPGAGMGIENFGVFQDAITSSFVSQNETETGAFEITFRARKSGVLSQMLAISDRITPAEAYPVDAGPTTMNLQLHFSNSTIENQGFEVFRNQPNPFMAGTMVAFNLPEAAEVSITVLDALGAVLYSEHGSFGAGINNIALAGSIFPCPGLYFCKVETSANAAVIKMLRN